MKHFIQNLRNNFDYFLRNKISLTRKNYFEQNESKQHLFKDSSLIELEKRLCEKFDLQYLKLNSTRQNYLDNLYTVHILEKYLDIKPRKVLKVLDIGCKNWFYAKGEYSFFKKYSADLQLDGVEIDTKRLYSNFYTRGEVAQFYIKGLKNTYYISKDFLKHNGKYDYLIWILPFVVKEPLLKWGLPLKYFKPETMLEHAYNSLNEGGTIFIINQGAVEYNIQIELCRNLKIPCTELGQIKSEILDYEIPRYAILIKK